MGQTFCVDARRNSEQTFTLLPLEVGFHILGYLDATSLCNLALVNSEFFRLANTDHIWRTVCVRKVPGLSKTIAEDLNLSWKQVHKVIQMFLFHFNLDCEKGLSMFIEMGLISPDPRSVALFLGRTTGISKKEIGRYIAKPARVQVLQEFVRLSECRGLILPEALKNFLARFEISKENANSRVAILESFAQHYTQSNPGCGLSPDTINILCFSLILLGTDLSSPHVKNKMSKREFIRNNKRIVQADRLSDDFLGELYDYIFLEGLFPIKQEPRRCNAVLNQLIQDSHQRWQILPRVLPLDSALNHV